MIVWYLADHAKFFPPLLPSLFLGFISCQLNSGHSILSVDRWSIIVSQVRNSLLVGDLELLENAAEPITFKDDCHHSSRETSLACISCNCIWRPTDINSHAKWLSLFISGDRPECLCQIRILSCREVHPFRGCQAETRATVAISRQKQGSVF